MFAWIANKCRIDMVLISTVDTAILWADVNNIFSNCNTYAVTRCKILATLIIFQKPVDYFWTYYVLISAEYKNFQSRVK
jgi:hypothetical protein